MISSARLRNPFNQLAALEDFVKVQWRKSQIFLKLLCYNEHCNWFYALETCLNPAFWFVDNYSRRLGPAFVCFLISLVGCVVSVAYIVIIPYELTKKSIPVVIFYITVGNWILINTIFHYGRAWNTSPGSPQVSLATETAGICRECIAPKPPRTHHCRICNRCILQMDHHCPWLNQCVGLYNRRYFFFTMFFMWLGCLVIVIGMWPSFVDHYWPEDPAIAAWCQSLYDTLIYSKLFCGEKEWQEVSAAEDWVIGVNEGRASDRILVWRTSGDEAIGVAVHNAIMFEFYVSLSIVVGVGGLMGWHALLITRAETSIEQHMNKELRKQFKRDGRVYRNPYDLGPLNNWKLFLGLDQPGRSFCRHVLLPSSHLPSSDALNKSHLTKSDPFLA